MRYLKLREDFIKNNNFSNYSLIKENSGPLANEIPWGDSLLGRLINSVIRKVEIGTNLVKMDSVIQRLKDEFDKLIADGAVQTLDDKDKSLVFKAKFSTLLGKLKEAVDNGEEVEKIKLITKDLIKDVELYKATSTEGEESKKDLLSKLNEFLKSLEGVGTNQGTKEETNHPKLVENFTSMYNILYQYNQMKKETGVTQKKLGETEKETPEQPAKVIKKVISKEVATKESINEQQEAIDVNLLKAIKPLYDYSKQYFTFPEDENTRKGEFENLISNDQNKLPLSKIYGIIKKKSGVNENLTNLLTKPEAIAEKMYNLYQVTKTKESGDFTGVGDNMRSSIASFNSSMKEIISPSIEKTEPKSESLIRYSQFVLLKEAEDPTKEVEASTGAKDLFYKIFDTDYINKWIITDELAKSLESKVEKASNSVNKISINGIDPIIEIVKVFNRAWKLHTVDSIPSGRGEGKVSERTKREYYYMGSGPTPKGAAVGGAGPWRNRALFDKWENAVHDIIKDSKYQIIFNRETTIKVGEADTRTNVDKEGKEGGGRSLLKFINSMLDGDDLYRKGAQSSFINQYFGIQVKDETLGYAGDKKGIDKTTNGLKGTTKYIFKKVDSIPDGSLLKEDDMGRRFFALKYNDGTHKTRYFFIDRREGDHIFVKFSPSFYQFKQYLKKTGTIELPKDVITSDKDANKKDLPIYYGKILVGDLPIKGGKTIKIPSFNISNYNKFKVAKKETGDVTEPVKEEISITGIEEVLLLVDINDKVVRLDDNIVTKGDGLDGIERDIYKSKLK